MVWRHHASQAAAAREPVPPRTERGPATCQGPEKKVVYSGIQCSVEPRRGIAGVRGELGQLVTGQRK